jgi:hypothetical protein
VLALEPAQEVLNPEAMALLGDQPSNGGGGVGQLEGTAKGAGEGSQLGRQQGPDALLQGSDGGWIEGGLVGGAGRRIQAGKTLSRSIWINFVLANLLSAGVGAGLLFIPGFPTGYGDGPDIMANPLWVSLAIGYGLFSFVLSILIEWAFYRYFPLFGGLRKQFQTSLWGNVCSFGILLSVMFFLIASNSKR